MDKRVKKVLEPFILSFRLGVKYNGQIKEWSGERVHIHIQESEIRWIRRAVIQLANGKTGEYELVTTIGSSKWR